MNTLVKVTSTTLLIDAFSRVREVVHEAVSGLGRAELSYRIGNRGNSMAWLVWHLTRIQDDHIAEVAELEQVWTAAGWAARFDLPFGVAATGYGHSDAEVAAVTAAAPDLLGYHDAVFDQTCRYLATIEEADLSRVVDRSWDPPVTLAVRLISVISDDLQHAGQAAFLRGVVQRRC
ncbi:MAG TPA: DUF664 domain-containing protein [Jatrophihabitantaceae bacterium]|jgi:uncharacterized damage-inducible protein DinB|nr:DUF664 domain-containing protein [Jatrophihabitantaceae bacterium]